MKNWLCVLLLVFVFSQSKAQKFGIEAGSGFAFNLTPNMESSSQDYYNGNSSTATYSTTRYGFAEGWNSRINAFYNLKPGLSVIIGGNYQSKKETMFYSSESLEDNGSYHSDYKYNYYWSHRVFELNTGMSIQAPVTEKLSFQLGFGATFNAFANHVMSNDYVRKANYDTTVYVDEYGKRIIEYQPVKNIGMYGDLGINYDITGNFGVFINGSLRSRTFSFKSGKVTEYTLNGADLLPGMNTADKEVVFLDTYHSTPNNNPNEPSKSLKFTETNGIVALQVGLRYTFGSNEKPAYENEALPGFYFTIQSGYGFNFNTKSSYNTYSTTSTDYEYTAVPYSLGSGMNYSLNAGYTIKNGISAEVGGMYNKGEFTTTYYSSRSTSSYVNYQDSKTVTSAKMYRILAGLRLEKRKNRCSVYLRSGISLGVGTKMNELYNSTSEYGQIGNTTLDYVQRERETSGGISIGGYGSLGGMYYFNDYIGVFSEIDFLIQNWSPEKTVLTKYLNNGTDMLPGMNVASKEIVYLEEYSQDGATPSTEEPTPQTKVSIPFSTAIIKLGVKINLAAKKEE